MDSFNLETAIREQWLNSPPDESRGRLRKWLTGVAFFAFFIFLCVLSHYLNAVLTQSPAKDGHSRSRIVEIPAGATVSDIADRLAEKQVISNEFVFKVVAAARGSAHELKAGEYKFDRSMSMIEVLGWLEEGHVMLHRLTVPEGLTVAQIAGLLANKGLASSEEIIRLANDPEFCKQLGVGGPNLEGFLYPDTYKLAKGLPAKAVIHIMVDRFWRKLAGEVPGEIEDGKKLRDIVTIASIVEKEAQENNEKPLIAGVIYNRMNRNMPLQCDVTIRYPLDNYGFELTAQDLRIDSPYNSYLYRGLPPTPICNPGISAIKAAVNPARTSYLYFVSMNNGHHKFSATLRQHNEAVSIYRTGDEHG